MRIDPDIRHHIAGHFFTSVYPHMDESLLCLSAWALALAFGEGSAGAVATMLLGFRQGAGTPVRDDPVFRAIRDPSPVVRYRVARAMHGKVSGEFAPLVERALEIDPAEQSALVRPSEV